VGDKVSGGKALGLIETDAKGSHDNLLIIQMILEHEKRLEQVEDDLRSIREYLTGMDALREHLSEWLVLTGSGVRMQKRDADERRTASENTVSLHRLLKSLREIGHQGKRDLYEDR